MKEIILNNMELIIAVITAIVTWVLGLVSKKSTKIKNNLIPIQNIIIMIIASGIYWYVTGDFSMVIASGSPVATMIYDTIHNLKKGE